MEKPERDFKRLLEEYYDPIVKEANSCPFCDGTLLALAEGKPDRIIPRPMWRIFCVSCRTLGPTARSKRMAVDFWNGKIERVTLKSLQR